MSQSNITTTLVITVCVTAAAGVALYYYYSKKQERSSKKMKATEPVPSREQAERPKAGDSTTATSSSGEAVGSNSQMEEPVEWTKIQSRKTTMSGSSVASSFGEAVGSSSASTGLTTTSTFLSGESYPPAVVREDRLKQQPPIQKTALGEKPKSESPGSTKPLAGDDVPSPREAIPIDSYCYCGQDIACTLDETELNENVKVELLPTVVKPVSFDPYSPEDLTQEEGLSDELSQSSLKIDALPENHYIIIPFLPILHAVSYASKHAQLLLELMQNYEYFESQALEMT